ncbi:hypothetical protein CB1_001108005 [Camelus ferus]|nr:hypothetical protein CB1_001108005 [Camelus ferus]
MVRVVTVLMGLRTGLFVVSAMWKLVSISRVTRAGGGVCVSHTSLCTHPGHSHLPPSGLMGDLNGQILSLSLYEAKNLFATQTKAQSLAAEIDTASRDELMEALKEQEEINFRLRQYMDKIILAILDHNPSILEIKH